MKRNTEQRLRELEDYKRRHQTPREVIAEHLIKAHHGFHPYWDDLLPYETDDNTVGWLYGQEIRIEKPTIK